MARISTPLLFDSSINALLARQSKLLETQLQISTGKKVNTPADDPIASSRLFTLKQALTDNAQYQKNADNALKELSLEETQLTTMLNKVSKMLQLAIHAGNGSLPLTELKTLTVEMQQVLEEMVDLANTNLDGHFMFSGSKVFTKPVLVDINGNYIYQGDEILRSAKISPTTEIVTNDQAKRLFFDIASSDINATGYSGRTAITSAHPGLVAVTTLQSLNDNELIINGINIKAATADTVSTTDNTASAIATAAAINQRTDLHGVVATANPTIFDFTGTAVDDTNPLVGTDFVINGVQITGTPAAATTDALVDLINNIGGTGVPGIVASNNGGELRLTAVDGRNIQLSTDGVAGGHATTFTNFDLLGGAPLDNVYRSTVTLNDHKSITLTGSSPADVGFTAGTYTSSANAGTGVLTDVGIVEERPTTISPNEKYLIVFDNPPNTFNIYRESTPTIPVTNFKMIPPNGTYKDAAPVEVMPHTFVSGESIIVDGIKYKITGTPSAGDTFTLDLEAVEKKDIFSSVRDLIQSIRMYGADSPRLSYEVGVALNDLNSAQDKLLEFQAKIGTKLNLAENQKKSNSEFDFFTQTTISQLEDLDIVSAISDLVRHQISVEAAQRSIAQIQRLSLFDFI